MEKQQSPDISSHISHSALTHLYLRHSSLLSSGGCRTRFTSSSKISGLIKLRNQAKKLMNKLCTSSVNKLPSKQLDLLFLKHVDLYLYCCKIL